ncbi:MAG: acyltransferase [Oligoflexia bacterium]|nr:acyltransferase [Oligoflexia bacterium]
MPQRIRQIDLLRGISILLVLFHHLDRTEMDPSTWGGRLLLAISSGGWVGVDLFFVLSGFLVSGLIFKELLATGSFRPWRFLGRRGMKIYPAFYLMLLASIPALGWLGEKAPSSQLWAEALFVQNYLPHLWSHTWSLAIEEQFYLLLTATLALLAWRDPSLRWARLVPKAVLLLCGAIFGARALTHAFVPFDIKSHYMPAHLRMDGLLFGVTLASVAAFERERFEAFTKRWRVPLLLGGLLLMAPCFLKGFGGWHVYTFGLTLLYLGAGCLLLGALGTPRTSLWVSSRPARALALIGFHSYSIYVWHLLVKHLVSSLALSPSAGALAFLAGALGAGILLGKTIEVPFLRLRERLLPASERREQMTSALPPQLDTSSA